MSELLLKPAKKAIRDRKRIGRGSASGQGGSAGRGTKGQLSRSGAKRRAWFEGGQMPLQRRVPKRGFRNIFRVEYQIVNLIRLDKLADESQVNAETLYEARLIRNRTLPVKVLGIGNLTKKLTVVVDAASKSAIDKIKAAGGTIEIIEKKVFKREDKKAKKQTEN